MTTLLSLLRLKGLGEGKATYAKGFGVSKRAWLRKNYPMLLYFSVVRTEMGTRQDSSTEAAATLYWNRRVDVEYLKIARRDKDPNKLRDFLWSQLSSAEIVGGLRARAAIDDKFTRSYRFFSAS